MSESAVDESSNLLTYVWDHWLKGTTLETMDPSMDCRKLLQWLYSILACLNSQTPRRLRPQRETLTLHADQSNSFESTTEKDSV